MGWISIDLPSTAQGSHLKYYREAKTIQVETMKYNGIYTSRLLLLSGTRLVYLQSIELPVSGRNTITYLIFRHTRTYLVVHPTLLITSSKKGFPKNHGKGFCGSGALYLKRDQVKAVNSNLQTYKGFCSKVQRLRLRQNSTVYY